MDQIFRSRPVTQREETRNITSVMTAQSNEGTIVVIVATKIRPDFPQDDSLLGKEKHRFEIGAQLYGADYELSDREEDGHRILEYTFLHEEYDPANFPFASGQKENAKGKETLGIHRIFVSSGQFFEVAMILTNSGAGVKELKEKAKAAVKQVVAGIKVNPVKK